MATAGQIRGALLEEVVLHLLEKVGYKIIRRKKDAVIQDGLHDGHSGLDVEGRGSWHQIDALAEWEHSPAFVHPIRLLVEGKCYGKRIGIDVVRNAVGVIKDISENHFSDRPVGLDAAKAKVDEFLDTHRYAIAQEERCIDTARDAAVLLKELSENPLNRKNNRKIAASGVRYNYLAAIFSATDYTSGAVEYAIAHQIFLIEYRKVPLVEPIIEAIKRIDENSFRLREREPHSLLPMLMERLPERTEAESAEPETQSKGDRVVGMVRDVFTKLLHGQELNPPGDLLISNTGNDVIEEIQSHLNRIGGSYFGMLNGRWPMHFVLREPLPEESFEHSDVVHCKVFVTNSGLFSFEPEAISRGQAGWFKLEASMPEPVKAMIFKNWTNDRERLNGKIKDLAFMTLSGKISGIQRNVRLELSSQWIREALDRATTRQSAR